MTLKQGSVLKGKSIQYVIESVLGQGSFGVTYKAKGYTKATGTFGEVEVELPYPVAIKEFFMREINQRDEDGSISGLSEGTMAYNYARKFRKEAERLALMDHPNIVHVMDFVEANNTFYYVMDFIDGEDITHYMKGKPLNEADAISIIKDVASALRYMHEKHKMLHLDLKPGNIMRRKSDGHIFLIDFGLSKHFSDEGQPDTSTTIGLGTEGYAPLEQGKKTSAHNSFRPTIDVYALGGTLFKMLTAETPPPASDLLDDEGLIEEIMNKHGVSQHLQKVIASAMMPSAKRRTPSVLAFVKEIDNDNTVEGGTGNNDKDAIDEETTIYVEPYRTQCDESKNSASNYCRKCDSSNKEIEPPEEVEYGFDDDEPSFLEKYWKYGLAGIVIILGIYFYSNWSSYSLSQQAVEQLDNAAEDSVASPIIDTEPKSKSNKNLKTDKQEEFSNKDEERSITKDENQVKVFVQHRDGRYSVIFREVSGVKVNDLKDFVQYAIKSGRKVLVESYQDDKTGSAAENEKICVKRANDAATLLNNMGVEASQIEIVARGGLNIIGVGRGYCVVSVSEEKVEDDKTSKEEEATVFEVVEQMPEFPDGQAALLKWIADNVKYPAVAEENGIQGRVVCTFVVERDGSITDIQVVRSIDPSLDKEAVRVLKQMPHWIPGRQNGSPVRVKYTVPITFRLQ